MSTYSEEQTKLIHELYKEYGNNGISKIAKITGKSEPSIIAKLSSDNVYISNNNTTRKKPSKKFLLRELEQTYNFNTRGFEQATIDALMRLLEVIRNKSYEN